jgi:hypothetical protein
MSASKAAEVLKFPERFRFARHLDGLHLTLRKDSIVKTNLK